MPGPGPGRGPLHFLTEEEKAQKPKVTKALLLRIFSYLKPYRVQFALVFAAILLSAVVGLLPSLITGRIVDEALIGRDMALLVRLILAALATLMLSEVIGVLESYINAWISARIIFDMKNQMYRHLQNMPHAFFASEKQGDIITRMGSDIDGVSSVVSGTLTSVVSNLATVVTTLAALFSMSWRLAIVGIAAVPLLILPTRRAGLTRYKLLSASQEKKDSLNQIINETLSVSGSLLVKLFAREEAEYQKFTDANEEFTRATLKEQRSGKWFRVLMGMFVQLGPLLIYFAGGYLIIAKADPALTVGTVTATVALVNRLYRPVQSLLNIQVDFTRSLALFNRIFDYFDRENSIRERRGGGVRPPLAQASLQFCHAAFSYKPEVPVLRDINFSMANGKMTAIVGPSGSGKSTLVNLLPRLYDVSGGSVRINNIDVRDFDLEWLRGAIGVVSQDSYLFNGTILENLRYAKPDATMAEVEAACRAANIHDFIAALPEGYHSAVGNRGLLLSGGEKQRLTIARVILKDPRILILDEATSSLDSISESAIQQALETLMKGRTSIVIAHRLSTILAADEILVLKGGVIAERGGHEELLAKNGIYRALYETQFRRVIDMEKQGEAEQ